MRENPSAARLRIQGRAAALILGLLTIVISAVLLRSQGPNASWLPGCVLHHFTGLLCPGCGMTRAAYATLHGDLAAAFRFNPLGMVLLPTAAAAISLEIAGWVRGNPLPFAMRLTGRGMWILLTVIIAFGILRNIPVWPCTWLAPP